MNEKLLSCSCSLVVVFYNVLSLSVFLLRFLFFSLAIRLFSLSFFVTYTSLCCLSAKFLQQKYTGGNRCFFFCARRSSSDVLKLLLVVVFFNLIFSSVFWFWPLFRRKFTKSNDSRKKKGQRVLLAADILTCDIRREKSAGVWWLIL